MSKGKIPGSGADVVVSRGSEDTVVEQIGGHQESKQDVGLFGMVRFAFHIITCWSALSGALNIRTESVGPPVMTLFWMGNCAAALAVAFSLAEMSSAHPKPGCQYSWVAILAPPSIARGLSYVCRWFTLIGIIAMGATNNVVGANLLLAIAELYYPTLRINAWRIGLLTYGFAAVSMTVNLWFSNHIDKTKRTFLLWYIAGFTVIVMAIPVHNYIMRYTGFVFGDFGYFMGLSNGYTAVIDALQTLFGICCYEAPLHMAKEMQSTRIDGPNPVLYNAYMGAVTGWIFLISLSLCIGDVNINALTPADVPMIRKLHNPTGPEFGRHALLSLVLFITLNAGNSITAEGSRFVLAFAQDNGLPKSKLWREVSKKQQIPVPAIILVTLSQIGLNTILFGTYDGFMTVVSIATTGFYLSYAMPLLARMCSHFKGHAHELEGLYSLGKWSIGLNSVGLVYLVFSIVTFNFPTLSPATYVVLHYTHSATGILILIPVVAWFVRGRKEYTGPPTGAIFEGANEIGQAGAGFSEKASSNPCSAEHREQQAVERP